MSDPRNVEEAEQFRYGQWAGNPEGTAFRPGRCFAIVYSNWVFRQCHWKAGPDGLCGVHRRKLKKRES